MPRKLNDPQIVEIKTGMFLDEAKETDNFKSFTSAIIHAFRKRAIDEELKEGGRW